eukprot:TRINITY_DN5257_c0_g4_i1.p1 TRINITY_DN5257_c0_g4~~TRINITY_DN5257_c0_g4_i1.p1  ORF type:complete len:151 (+),score=15.95 TRINITY_DN5257_c0_g4_i1:60-512(+)
MPAPAAAAAMQGMEKVVEASNKAYVTALQRWPKKYVLTGLGVIGGLFGTVAAQSMGWVHIHDALDFEVPSCKKVHVFITEEGKPSRHVRLPGGTRAEFLTEKSKKGTYVALSDASAYAVDPRTPLWTLCRSTPQPDLPSCSIKLQLVGAA